MTVGSETAKGSGLLMDSLIMTGNLATIHDSEIDRVIGTFAGLQEIDEALRTTLALSVGGVAVNVGDTSRFGRTRSPIA